MLIDQMFEQLREIFRGGVENFSLVAVAAAGKCPIVYGWHHPTATAAIFGYPMDPVRVFGHQRLASKCAIAVQTEQLVRWAGAGAGAGFAAVGRTFQNVQRTQNCLQPIQRQPTNDPSRFLLFLTGRPRSC